MDNYSFDLIPRDLQWKQVFDTVDGNFEKIGTYITDLGSKIIIDTFTAIEGQEDFNLSSEFLTRRNSLAVYLNGVRQFPETGFVETSNSSFKLTTPCQRGDKVIAVYHNTYILDDIRDIDQVLLDEFDAARHGADGVTYNSLSDSIRGQIAASVEAERSVLASQQEENNAAQEQNNLDQERNNADQAVNNQAAQGLIWVDLTEDQLDPDTRVPVIEGEFGKLYFAPSSSPQENDKAEEWIVKYSSTAPNNKVWERVGSSQAVIPNSITTTQIDQIWGGQQLSGTRVLSEPGLSYFSTLVKNNYPKLATTENGGLIPQLSGVEDEYLNGKGAWKTVKLPDLVSVLANGLMPKLSGNANEFINGEGNWIQVETEPRMPDPRELRSLLDTANNMHSNAHTEEGDYEFGSWVATAGVIAALKAAIDAAKAVSDGYGQTVFTQGELDAARDALQKGIDAFKAAAKEIAADKSAYDALVKRVSDVSAVVSADGKDVPFGTKWVSSAAKTAIDQALATAKTAVEKAKKQSEIDAAVSTLTSAVTTFEGAVKTATADTAALDKAISDTVEAMDGVVVSADGEGLDPSVRYVTDQKTLDDITSALNAARTAKTTATKQSDLDSATKTLTDALDKFNSLVLLSSTTFSLSINSTVSDPKTAVTYGDDVLVEAGWENWKNQPIFKDIRPCVVKEGKVQYYLRRDDYTAKVTSGKGDDSDKKQAGDGTAKLTGTDGDVMIEIPLVGYKLEYAGDTLNLSLTDAPGQEGYCYRAHSLETEGDCDFIYVGAYLSSGSASKLNSYSGKSPCVNINIGQARTGTAANGAGYQQLSWYVWTLMQCLYLMVYKNLDSQTALGKGYVTGNSAVTTTGQTNSTGFCSSSGTATDGKHQVKCLGIEDFWGNAYQWCDGIYSDNSRKILTDYKGFNDTGNGYQFSEASGFSSNGGNFFKKAAGTNIRGFLPYDQAAISGGSATTYFCDSAVVNAGCLANVGGSYSNDTRAGAFHCSVGFTASNAAASLGARAVYKHKG